MKSSALKDLLKYVEYFDRLPFQIHLARVKACIDQDGKIDLSKLRTLNTGWPQRTRNKKAREEQ